MNVYTSEQVSNGHPDKLCDQIADRILCDCLAHDEDSRVAIECLIKGNQVVIAGELSGKYTPDYRALVKEVFDSIGQERLGYSAAYFDVEVLVRQQSPDIALGVDKGGAGDQGMVYGYATAETPELLPIPYMVATRFLRLLAAHPSRMFRADAKAQVSYDYDSGRITTFLCSVQHSEDVEPTDFCTILETLMIIAASEYGLNTDFEKLINPTGRFVIGGPFADCGVTGRKLACDTYGGLARFGGGAHCVDGDTEFLTPNGFKKIRDYQKGDLVGQWNLGKLEFVTPDAYIKSDAGVMYHVRTTDALDMVLSENHDVVLFTQNGNVIKKQAKLLFENGGLKNGNHGFIPVAFQYEKQESGLHLSDDEIRLQVAFCADGSIIQGKGRDRVRVKKGYKVDRMRYLLAQTNTCYTESKDNEFRIFWFAPPVRARLLSECLQGADSRQIKIIADEVQRWDGEEGIFRTTKKCDADFIQFAFMASYGTNASITVDNRIGQEYNGGYKRKSICYQVYESVKSFV